MCHPHAQRCTNERVCTHTRTHTHTNTHITPDQGWVALPGGHVTLGLGLAEFAHGAGQLVRAHVPAGTDLWSSHGHRAHQNLLLRYILPRQTERIGELYKKQIKYIYIIMQLHITSTYAHTHIYSIYTQIYDTHTHERERDME